MYLAVLCESFSLYIVFSYQKDMQSNTEHGHPGYQLHNTTATLAVPRNNLDRNELIAHSLLILTWSKPITWIGIRQNSPRYEYYAYLEVPYMQGTWLRFVFNLNISFPHGLI